MKKSFDYFKMLKDMSRINSQLFFSVVSGGEYKANTIEFYGQRFELLEKLTEDFVAPIERNDIYNLTHSLYTQFCNIIILTDIIDDSFSLSSEYHADFQALFSVQSDIMSGFGKKGEYLSLLKVCRQGQQRALTVKRRVVSNMLTELGESKQPLYRCVVMNGVMVFCESLFDTFNLCERVFINNI